MKSIFVCLLLATTAFTWSEKKLYSFADNGRRLGAEQCYLPSYNKGKYGCSPNDFWKTFPTLTVPGINGCNTPLSKFPAPINPGKGCSDAGLEAAVNRLRTNPAAYASYFRHSWCDKSKYGIPKSLVDSTINMLMWQQKNNVKKAMRVTYALRRVAAKVVDDNIKMYSSSSCSTIAHGANADNPMARVKRETHKDSGPCGNYPLPGENIAGYSVPTNCVDIVSRWTFDFGLISRAHYKSITVTSAKYFGCSYKRCGNGEGAGCSMPVGLNSN